MKGLMVFLTFLFCQIGMHSGLATSIPPTLVTDLSKKIISINVNFSGSKFHIFGAVKRGFSQNASIDQPPFDIMIEVIGPPVSLELFKKERLYGFWINKKIRVFDSMPSFYSLSGTKPLGLIVEENIKKANKIGLIEQIKTSENLSIDDTIIANIKLTGKSNVAYKEESKQITFLENTLFSTEIDLPTDLVEGDYLVRIHLIRFKEVLATQEDIIYVKKVGIEQWVHYLAYNKPKAYGLIAILLAIAFGWTASFIFSRKAY